MLGDGTEPPGWAEFVEAFVQSAGSCQRRATARASVRLATQAQILAGRRVAASRSPGSSPTATRANVTASETYVFTGLGGQRRRSALILPAYLDAGGAGQVQGVWDYALTALTDGTTVAPATAVYQAQSGGLIGTFLAQYTAPDGGVTDIGGPGAAQQRRARSRA